MAREASIGMMLSGLLLGLALTPVKSEPQLLDRAKWVLNVGKWREVQWSVGEYLWLSSTRILAFLPEKWQRLIDTASGEIKTLPLPAVDLLEGVYSPIAAKITALRWNEQLDGKLACPPELNTLHWRVVDPLTGRILNDWSNKTRSPQPMLDVDNGCFAPESLWSADGRSIYQIEYWPEKVGFSVHVTRRNAANPQLAHYFPPKFINDYDTYVCIHDKKALLVKANWLEQKDWHLAEWHLDHPAGQMRNWVVKGPGKYYVVAYHPSPDFKLAVWEMCLYAGDPDKTPTIAVSLWVSGFAGRFPRLRLA